MFIESNEGLDLEEDAFALWERRFKEYIIINKLDIIFQGSQITF